MQLIDPANLNVNLTPRKYDVLIQHLKEKGLKYEQGGIFGEQPKGFLLTGDNKLYVSPLNKKRKDYQEQMLHLCALRSYLATVGSVVNDENFLHTFDTFDVAADKESHDAARRFLESDSKLKGLWLKGKAGTGKSHLLLSIIYEAIRNKARNDLKELSQEQHNNCPAYKGGRERILSRNAPQIVLKNYNEGFSWDSDSFNELSDKGTPRKLIFLDDVYERDKENIAKTLLNMFRESEGHIVITSNIGISEWTRITGDGRSTEGLESRLLTFFKEFEMNGSTRRKTASW